MRIEAVTASPAEMVAAMDKAILVGDLRTWKVVKDAEGNILYTHTPGDWNEKALIGRVTKPDKVVFIINHWTNAEPPTVGVEGYYLGRFTEALLVHFRNYFRKLEVFA